MDTSKFATSAAAQFEDLQQSVETEISKLMANDIPKWRSDEKDAGSDDGTTPFPQETELERLRSSIAQLTSSSIDGLEHLTSELEKLEGLLHSEVRRVKNDVDSALAGIKIIIEAIAPLRNRVSPPLGPSIGTRNVHTATAKTSGSR